MDFKFKILLRVYIYWIDESTQIFFVVVVVVLLSLKYRGEVIYRLILSHSDLTTEEVVSGTIEWPLPPVLRLKTWNKVHASINMEVVNETDRVKIKVREENYQNNNSS